MPTATMSPLPLHLKPPAQAIQDLQALGNSVAVRSTSSLTPAEIQEVRDCLNFSADHQVIEAALYATKYHRKKADFLNELVWIAEHGPTLKLQCASIRLTSNSDNLDPFAPMIAKLAAPGNPMEITRACAGALESHFGWFTQNATDPALFISTILGLLNTSDDPTIQSALGAITERNFSSFVQYITTLAKDHTRPNIACAALDAIKHAPDLQAFFDPIRDALQQTACPQIARSAIYCTRQHVYHTHYIPQPFIPLVSAATDHPDHDTECHSFLTIGASKTKQPFFTTLKNAAEDFVNNPRKSMRALSAMKCSVDTPLFMATLEKCVQGPEDVALEALQVVSLTLLCHQSLPDASLTTILLHGMKHPDENVIYRAFDTINYRTPSNLIPQLLPTIQTLSHDTRHDVACAASKLLLSLLNRPQPYVLPQGTAITPQHIIPPTVPQTMPVLSSAPVAELASTFSGIVLDFNIPENDPGCGPNHATPEASAALTAAFNLLQAQDPNKPTVTCFASVFYNNDKPIDEGIILQVDVARAELPDIIAHVCQGTSPICTVEILSGCTPNGHRIARVNTLSAPLRN